MNSITELSATEISKRIKSGEMMVKECIIAFVEEIKQKNSKIGAFARVDLEGAFRQAVDVQRRIDKKEPVSVLAGVPFAVCENVFADGFGSECGSKMLKGFKNTYDSTVIERMKKAGAIFLGSVRMSEFGISAVNGTSFSHGMRNPWNPLKTAGSNAAAAAVISGLIPIVIGTDCGLGVSVSAALCGTTALTVSEGAVSRYGVFPAVPSIERMSVTAKTVSDAAAVLHLVGGSDGKDPVCTRKTVVLPNMPVKYMKIGVPSQLTVGLKKDIRARVLSVPEGLRQMGATVDMFSMPITEKAPAAHYVISSAEMAVSLAKYDGRMCTSLETRGMTTDEIRGSRFEFETKKRIMLGNSYLNEKNYDSIYKQAVNIRRRISASFAKVLGSFDLIAAPVTSDTAPGLNSGAQEDLRLLECTAAPALAGLPYVVISCGYTEESMPVGCMLIGRKNYEATLLSAAAAFQKVTGYHELTAKF